MLLKQVSKLIQKRYQLLLNSIKPNANININKIFEKGESSKTEKSGLGLWEVKKIISSKDNSQIYTNIVDNTFYQTIVIEKA